MGRRAASARMKSPSSTSVKMMVADAELFARGIDALGRIELGRVDAEVDVGHERAEHDHAVAVLDEAA